MFINLFNMFEPFYFFFDSMVFNMLLLGCLFLFQKNNFISYKNFFFKDQLSCKILFSFFFLFILILCFNLMGLLPWTFCNTAHISLNFPIAISFWLMILMWELNSASFSFILNMTPKSSPMFLSFFLVFIESISKIIQPLTLSLRLTANMIAGHMIINLLSSFINSIAMMISSFYFFFLLMILFLEIGVAVIQGYVFTFLLYLYSK